ncbi:unannotated protein [freshwater metagenome]|uniref:Unannotated protein n=1 Tax=freshwater metagenome TaxID=449393 RepID=A0A6J6ZDM5_9ZZZZ
MSDSVGNVSAASTSPSPTRGASAIDEVVGAAVIAAVVATALVGVATVSCGMVLGAVVVVTESTARRKSLASSDWLDRNSMLVPHNW